MAGEWLGYLRAIAGRVRGALLDFLEKIEIPRSAAEAKALEKEADGVACRALLDALGELGLSCVLVCEDLGVREIGSPGPGGPYLVVDPLDGTRNFTRGIWVASVSLAVCSGPGLEHAREALVLDIFTGREFWAVAGHGAFSSKGKLSASTTSELDKAVVSVDQSRLKRSSGSWVVELASAVDATRQLGSAALELCLLASGALDAHVDIRGRIRPTDVAAGLLIAREAGAWAWVRGSQRPGIALTPDEKILLLAAAPGLFASLRELLRPFLPEGGLILEGAPLRGQNKARGLR